MADPKELRELPFFSDLADDELEVVSTIVTEDTFEIGETVFEEGQQGESLFIIKRGDVKACKMTPEGELLTLTHMEKGEIFGEMSFLDGSVRSATIVSTSELKCFVMNKSDFDKFVDSHPKIVFKLLKNMIYSIHPIVRRMNTRYMDMINYMWGRKRGG